MISYSNTNIWIHNIPSPCLRGSLSYTFGDQIRRQWQWWWAMKSTTMVTAQQMTAQRATTMMMMIATGKDEDIYSMNSYQSSIIWIHTPTLTYEFITSPLLAFGDPSPTPLAVRYDDDDNGNGQQSQLRWWRHDGWRRDEKDNDDDCDGQRRWCISLLVNLQFSEYWHI